MDPGDSEEARRYVDENVGVSTEGYSIADEVRVHPRWICQRCVDDLADQFGWQVIDN